ncbi:hypothetical protein MBLNU457_g0362t1 [Dothideomycetes sp. NU457]
MDCFPDYCLTCDKQITDGIYCSQTCRLTDLERAGSSPTSPLAAQPFSLASASLLSAFNNISILDLNSTINNAQRATSSVSLNSTLRNPSNQPGQRRPSLYHTYSAPQTPTHVLSSSSSRSSLSSSSQSGARSRQTWAGISQEAKDELKNYYDAIESRQRRRKSCPPPQHDRNSTGMTPLSGFYDD